MNHIVEVGKRHRDFRTLGSLGKLSSVILCYESVAI